MVENISRRLLSFYIECRVMLRYSKLLSLLVLFIVIVGCSSDDTDGTIYVHPLMKPQCSMMGFMGKIHGVSIHNAEMDMVELKAEFDAAGHCIYWDATGVADDEESLSMAKSIGSGWLSTPARYSYVYNEKGQLVSVACEQLGGEVEHFEITYGDHQLSLPLPFPVGTLYPFMVKGIKNISSEHYQLLCDGSKAFSEQKILSWMSLTEKSEFVFENQKVAEQTSRLFSSVGNHQDTQLQRKRIFYEYDSDVLKRLFEITVEEEGNQEKIETLYDTSNPYRVKQRRFYIGLETIPLYETDYIYDTVGRLVCVKDDSGEGFFEVPYTLQYIAFDEFENWSNAIRTYSEDEKYTISQKIKYW